MTCVPFEDFLEIFGVSLFFTALLVVFLVTLAVRGIIEKQCDLYLYNQKRYLEEK